MSARTSVPAAAVVIAAHNGERFLGAAIESVLRQTLSDIEVIIVDDSSSDGTHAVVSELAEGDSRIRYVLASAGSAGAARNIGWRASHAPYVANLDQDDLAEPDRLERQVAFLDEHPDIALVGGFCHLVDSGGERRGNTSLVFDPDEVTGLLLAGAGTPVTHATATFRRSVLEEVGGYREIPGTVVEDLDLFLRIAERYRVANVPAYLGGWRVHSTNSSQNVANMARWTLAAQGTSRIRRCSGVDPLDGLLASHAPTDVELERVGVGPEELRRATFEGHLMWVHLLLAVDSARAAAGHVAAARSLLGGGLEEGSSYLVACARTEFALRCRLRSGATAGVALFLAPRLVARSLAHPVLGGLGRAGYGCLPAGGGRVGRSLRGVVVKRLNSIG